MKKGCYILNYLYTRPNLANFVTNSLVQVSFDFKFNLKYVLCSKT